MKQITIMIDDDQQVEQIIEVLSDFDAVKSIDVDPTWSADEQDPLATRIIESDLGPMINHSRVSVYDVMEAHDEGYSIHEIYQTYNLSSSQIEAALAYIKEHRAKLEPELKAIQAKQAENEAYHRALVAERERQIVRELTPERIRFNELLERSRRSYEAV